jgi:hypothetical protein
VPTVGQKEIGLDCPWIKAGGRICRGKLRDNILDWEHNLPEKDLEMADMHSTYVHIYTNIYFISGLKKTYCIGLRI